MSPEPLKFRKENDFDDHSVGQYGRLWRFAPAVLGLLDLARPKAKGMKRDELTYTSIKDETGSSVPV
jgi:hypothetical protein